MKYINRDISWLSFNYRVLEEAKDKSVPLFERLKFLAIYSSNLDEFYKVRVASYRRLLFKSSKNVEDVSSDPAKVLENILRIVDNQQKEFGKIFWSELIPELKENNIILLNKSTINKSQKHFITHFFYEEVIPYLQPVLLLKGKISPFLQDDVLYLAIRLFKKSTSQASGERTRKGRYAIVNIPTDQVSRFIELPEKSGKYYIIFLDDIIKMNLDALFPGYTIDSSFCIKLSRDADLGIDDEFTGDLIEKISKSLVKRKTGIPSRFLYDSDIPEALLKLLRDVFKLSKRDLIPGGKYHNFSDLFSFTNPIHPKLENKSLPALNINDLDDYNSIFEAISHRDWMLHFPYHSYDPVIKFLNEAAIDPKVDEIKATQYRVASDSAVVNALINAANNRKKVTVFVEVKARFDEYSNLHFAKIMKKAGINIIYSIPGLKVHAKVALILRKPSKNKKDAYAFLSTGNFNEKTAKIYADHGLFTSDEKITGELQDLFKYLEKQVKKIKLQQILVAQFNMKEELIGMIDREIKFAKKGKPAWMILKMNGLDNKMMIDKLYEAGKKGVKIDLIVRGICCLVPGKKFSHNITVTRIVDRFLEHARVFVFSNGGNLKMYMASADWMNRNLNRRIELAFPVNDEKIKNEVMAILNYQLSDNTKARILDHEHNNLQKITTHQRKVRAQIDTYNMLKNKNSDISQ